MGLMFETEVWEIIDLETVDTLMLFESMRLGELTGLSVCRWRRGRRPEPCGTPDLNKRSGRKGGTSKGN